jgi:hypothetical protein
MNINVYLPDDLGKRAKEAGLPFSELLRGAVVAELERREAVASTLEETSEHELYLENKDGVSYIGRVTGTIIGRDRYGAGFVFLTDDERVLVYDENRSSYWISEDPEEDLRELLDDAEYFNAMQALGIKAVIDL